jgi:hypothetical protein
MLALPSKVRRAFVSFLSVKTFASHARPNASPGRDGVTGAYLLRSAEYQFCNCGVFGMHACRMSTCIQPTLGIMEGNMAKKAKKAKKKTAKKKKK